MDDGRYLCATPTCPISTFHIDHKVEAQTPDGTHVPTPGKAPSTSATPRTSTPKTSYAAALKAKPSDWHLEFFMDDHKLPLDLTIYGAIHQHDMRKHKVSGSAFVPSMSWQGIYSIKFKKVPGPLPLSDGKTRTLLNFGLVLIYLRSTCRRHWIAKPISCSVTIVSP